MRNTHRPGRFALVLTLTGLLALLSASRAFPREPKADKPAPAMKRYEVKTTRNITYYTIPKDPDASRHRLDVYRPRGKGPFPVLFFVHGGGWVSMSKDDVLGLLGYGTIARCLAERGFVVVLPNYRLSPAVKHPEHIKDVARAFAWTCRNIDKYGGSPRQIFLGGHSAGGHLVALLATDDTYLMKEGRTRKDIRGVICVSGVYRVDDLTLNLSAAMPSGNKRMKLTVRPLVLVFGNDPKVLRQASPLTHVRPGLPPFLVINGGLDYPQLTRMTKEFAAAMKKNGCAIEVKKVPWRTHETLLFDIPNLSADRATVDLIAEFIDRHTQGRPTKEAKKGR